MVLFFSSVIRDPSNYYHFGRPRIDLPSVVFFNCSRLLSRLACQHGWGDAEVIINHRYVTSA